MHTRHIIAGAMALVLVATLAEAQQQKKPRRDRNLITAEEIAEKSAQTAYDAIKGLRPQWLTVRGPTTIMGAEIGIQIYRDGSKMGSADELRSIPADQIEQMRFLSAGDATMRYGTDHPNGAIELTLKR